jgi:serine protease Do
MEENIETENMHEESAAIEQREEENKLKNSFLHEEINFNPGVKSFLAGVLASLLVILVGFGAVWYYRANVFSYFAKEYVAKSNLAGNQSGDAVGKILDKQTIFSQESLVVDAVKQANPAVVSIIISKVVPKYDVVQKEQPNPFGELFPGLNFTVPEYVQNGTEKKEVGGGSGFFVSSDGLIITNKHVVEDKTAEYTAFTNDGKKHIAKVIARDSILDIAVLKVEGFGFTPLLLGDSDKVNIGQSVIAIGNALGEFKNTVSVGVVSGLARSVTAGDSSGKSELLDHVIQTDAAINPGNSGGPLLDLSGRVIGVNVAVAQGSQNIGFALPINSIKTVVASVKATGKIIRPYLGVRYVMVNEELKEKNKLTVDYGALVKNGTSSSEPAVIAGSPAAKAGIVKDDIILSINGTKITEDTNLSVIIRDKKVGDVLTLKVLHKGEEKTIQVTLEAAKE